jgi:hypothetical protein
MARTALITGARAASGWPSPAPCTIRAIAWGCWPAMSRASSRPRPISAPIRCGGPLTSPMHTLTPAASYISVQVLHINGGWLFGS